MTTAIALTGHDARPRPWLRAALIPGLLGLAGGMAIVATVPPSLGTLLGGLAAATVMLPGLVLAQQRRRERLVAVVCFTVALAATWLPLLDRGILHMGEWLLAGMVLSAYGWGIGGLGSLLWMFLTRATKEQEASGAVAAAGAVVIGVLWLSWPIWTAPWLSGSAGDKTVARLVAAHPAFALNGRLMRAFPVPWAQYRLAYELTSIGDDVPYEMPKAIWPCLLLHGLAGLGVGCRTWERERGRPLPKAAGDCRVSGGA